MSQHFCNTVCQDRPVRVTLGWDRPLQYFFLVVGALDEELVEANECSIGSDANGHVYCNLDDDYVPAAVDKQLAYFQQRLVELNILVRAIMFKNVEVDRQNNVRTRHLIYQPDGSSRQIL